MKVRAGGSAFPMLLAALVLCGTALFPMLFNPSTRWLYVGACLLLAVSDRLSWRLVSFPLYKAAFLYLFWCLFTVMWSEIPELSFYKVLAAILVSVGVSVLGFVWMARQKRKEDIWKAFFWSVPSFLLVALLGKGGEAMNQNIVVISGVAGNPNFLGWLMTVVFLPLFWYLVGGTRKTQWKIGVSLALLVCIYYLVNSYSRGSMLIVAFVVMTYFYVAHPSAKIKAGVFGVTALAAAFLLTPNLSSIVYENYILKGSELDMANAWEQSRGRAFEQSLEGAIKGGLIGGGYGISIGSDPSGYRGGLTSVGYGREKGSSPLAIIEETGIIGLVLVLNVLRVVIVQARRALRCSADRRTRSQVGILLGYFLGILVLSNFEAWFVAPGSPESLFFWAYTGMVSSYYMRVIADSGKARKMRPA